MSSTVGFNEAALGNTSCSEKSPISVCSTAPCVATVIGNGQRGSWAVAADDDSVFFEQSPTVLARVPVGGGAAREVRTDLERIWMAAVDEEYVYTTEFDAGVRRVKKSGGASELVMDPRGHPTAIALDRDHVYVTLTDQNQIAMAPKGGGEPTLLAGQNAPPAIAVDERYVYWVNQGTESASSGELVRAPLGDLTGARVLLSGLDSPNALAVGDHDVYFASGAQVFKVSKAGGGAELFEEDFGALKSMVAHEDALYLAGQAGLGRARAGAATQVVDSHGTLGLGVSCQGVFATGWFESLLVQYSP